MKDVTLDREKLVIYNDFIYYITDTLDSPQLGFTPHLASDQHSLTSTNDNEASHQQQLMHLATNGD